MLEMERAGNMYNENPTMENLMALYLSVPVRQITFGRKPEHKQVCLDFVKYATEQGIKAQYVLDERKNHCIMERDGRDSAKSR